jgi:hypothetical protein
MRQKKWNERRMGTARKAVLNSGCTANSTSCDGSWTTGREGGKRKRENEK